MLVPELFNDSMFDDFFQDMGFPFYNDHDMRICLLYTSPSPRDGLLSRMPSSA